MFDRVFKALEKQLVGIYWSAIIFGWLGFILLSIYVILGFAGINFAHAEQTTIHYTYDDLNRLTHVTQDSRVTEYKFDEVHNITLVETKYEATEFDVDADGVINEEDNCVNVSNERQMDTDGDGYGNMCDCDFNQSGACDGSDYLLLGSAFNKVEGHEDYNSNVDMNSSGAIDGSDFLMFGSMFNKNPGPSGLSCAWTNWDIENTECRP